MTYCVGYWLEEGLVLASDSRTNAGVDYISTYSKMHVFQPGPDRLFVLLAAGSLATTQAVVSTIRRDLDQGFEASEASRGDLRHCDDLFEAAAFVGRVSVAAQKQNEAELRSAGSSSQATFILGGQIGSEPHGLYLIYPQGNAIMATRETPYLQIGESKYGKPPLDNVGHTNLSLDDAAKLCVMSQVLTQRSNLTVAPGKGALASWSPPLDEAGNSVRGQHMGPCQPASLMPEESSPEPVAGSQARRELLALLRQEPRGAASRQGERVNQLCQELERSQPADLAAPGALELLQGVWELRWSSSRQPYLAVGPWLENLQLLAPSQGRGMNLLRLPGALG
ncbi:MAG: hypothetical protein ACKOPS_23215, partial [Cyanobium sp.]